MFKTISYHYKYNKNELKVLSFLCHISKNVYNVALYELRQSYLDTKTIPTYFDLNKLVSKNINSHVINTYQALCINPLEWNFFTFVLILKINSNIIFLFVDFFIKKCIILKYGNYRFFKIKETSLYEIRI